jgi:hypothetical protein
LRVVCDRAGLSAEVGKRQDWVVGGSTLTVEWWLNERYCYRLLVLEGWPPTENRRRGLLLAEVFAIALSGVVGDLRERRPELARWKARLVIEAGLVAAPRVEMKALPADAPESARIAWPVINSVVQVRRLTDDDDADEHDGIPLVASYLSRWSGLDESVFVSGKRWLARHAYIEHVGEAPGRFGKPTKLWRVAALPRREQALLDDLYDLLDAREVEPGSLCPGRPEDEEADEE